MVKKTCRILKAPKSQRPIWKYQVKCGNFHIAMAETKRKAMAIKKRTDKRLNQK